jgi:exodeoxyribonuclease VII large subunit
MEQIALSWGPEPNLFTVSELTEMMRGLLAQHFTDLWVSGEISGTRVPGSGHYYFTLKDHTAQLRCVCYKMTARYLKFKPQDGIAVIARGRVDLYEARGEVQFIVEALEPQGHGALQLAFEQLKKKLALEGLFDPARKRALPPLPERIGIVTSPTGAAIQDMLNILGRRFPGRHIRIYPAQVQGDGAAEQIACGIEYFSRSGWAEVLVVARGGGSLEDLWAFNEERVARAIAASAIPVISAVGHETDFTIADFVADLRAPTPTAAAEMAVSARADWLAELEMHAQDLTRAFKRHLNERAQTLDWLSRRLVNPRAAIMHERVKLENLHNRLHNAVRTPQARARFTLGNLQTRLKAQLPETRHRSQQIADLERRLQASAVSANQQRRHALQALTAQMELLNPQRTLERGYAMVADSHGKLIRNPNALQPRTAVMVKLAEGTAEVGIASVQTVME